MKKIVRGGIPILLLLCACGFAQAESAQPNDSRAEKLMQLKSYLRGSSESGAVAKPEARHPPKKDLVPADMRERAASELRVDEKHQSANADWSSAVVKTQNIEVRDPLIYHGLQLGFTAQPYAPQGAVPLVNLGTRDLSTASSTWMMGVEGRYIPWSTSLLGRHGLGFRVGASYSRQGIDLAGPTGMRLQDSALHALQSYALLTQEWNLWESAWSFNFDFGVSRFDVILTSASSLGEVSDHQYLGVVRTGPSWRAGDFSLHLNFEYREPLSNSWAEISQGAVVFGVLYGLR